MRDGIQCIAASVLSAHLSDPAVARVQQKAILSGGMLA
jgi:hypothetical protein